MFLGTILILGIILLINGCSKETRESYDSGTNIAAPILGTWKEKGHSHNEFTLDSNKLFQKGWPIVVGDQFSTYLCKGVVFCRYKRVFGDTDSLKLTPNWLSDKEIELNISNYYFDYNKKFVR